MYGAQANCFSCPRVDSLPRIAGFPLLTGLPLERRRSISLRQGVHRCDVFHRGPSNVFWPGVPGGRAPDARCLRRRPPALRSGPAGRLAVKPPGPWTVLPPLVRAPPSGGAAAAGTPPPGATPAPAVCGGRGMREPPPKRPTRCRRPGLASSDSTFIPRLSLGRPVLAAKRVWRYGGRRALLGRYPVPCKPAPGGPRFFGPHVRWT